MMTAVTDKFGREIRLTDERWRHIVHKHPVLKNLRIEFENTISDPEIIKRSIYDSEVLLYYSYFKEISGGKYIAAVIKINDDNFVVTGYVTNRVKEGEIIWKKS